MLSFEQNGSYTVKQVPDGFIENFLIALQSANFAKKSHSKSHLTIISKTENKLSLNSNSTLFSSLTGYDTLELECPDNSNEIHYRITFHKWAYLRLLSFFFASCITGFLLLSHLFSIYLFPDFDYPSTFEISVYIIPMMIFWGVIWPWLLIRKYKRTLKENIVEIFLNITLKRNKQLNKLFAPQLGFFRRHLLREQISWVLLLTCCIAIGYFLHRRIRLGPAQFGYSITSSQPDWKMPREHFSSLGVDLNTVTKNDFPGFLGKKRDASVDKIKLNPDWKQFPPKLIWRQPIGAGWSAFSVVNGFAITMEQRGPEEQVTCYGVNSGKPYWRIGWDCRFFLFGDGPRSTPAISNGQVFALGAFGKLVCIDGNSGTLIWQTNILKILGITSQQDHKELLFGRSNSPIVVGNMVIIPGGGYDGNYCSLMAFNAKTGKLCWKGGDQNISYSSPQIANLLGEKQIIIVNEASVSSHNLQTGQALWSYPWAGNSDVDVNASQAVPIGNNLILLSKGYRTGAVLLEIFKEKNSEKYEVKVIWRNRDVLRTKFTNITIWDNHIYALSDTRLECVELMTGKRCWKKGRYGYGQILRIGDKLLVQSEYGKISLVHLTPDKPNQVLGSFQALRGRTWNNIALYGHFLLVRNATEAACYELPKLQQP